MKSGIVARTHHTHRNDENSHEKDAKMDGYCASESIAALLGAVIIDGLQNPDNPKAMPQVSHNLKPGDIPDRMNRELCQTMFEMYREGDPYWDIVAVQNEATRSKRLHCVEGSKLILNVFAGAITSVGVSYHLNEIKEARQRRNVAAFKAAIADMPADGFMERSESAFLKLREKSSDASNVSSFSKITREAVSALEKAMDAKGFSGVPSGFPLIDKYTGGWQPGELIVIAGRPGMGKSVFAKDSAGSAGKPVGYFNLEMSNIEQAKRHITGICGVDFGRIETGRITASDCTRIIDGLDRKGELPIFYSDQAILTVDEICSISLGMKIRENIGLVVIDYLQLISPTERLSIRQEEVAAISRRLKLLARELELPILLLAQLNRKCESREDKRPIQADLRESGAIEQDADIVAFLYRESRYDAEATRIRRNSLLTSTATAPLEPLTSISMVHTKNFTA